MRMLMVISLVAVGLGLALVVREPAYARTRTPTPTARPTITATPSPSPCPTALAPEQVAQFSGERWLYAPGPYPPGPVRARIDGTVCSVSAYPPSCGQPPAGLQPPITIPSDPGPITGSYAINVLPASTKPGCGYEGAQVTFYFGDTQATKTATWHAGRSQEVDLTTLPAFAFFHGRFGFPDKAPAVATRQVHFYAFVNGNLCGREIRGVWMGESFYYVTVRSAEQQPGCGTEGAEVTFELADTQDNILGVAREKGIWHAWGEGNVGQELDLTMDPVGGITIGNVGDGSSQGSGTALWKELSLVMAAMGLGGFAAGVALRKRAESRPSA